MAKLRLSYPVFRQAPRVTCGSGSLRALLDAPDLERAVFMTSAAPHVRDALGALLSGAGLQLSAANAMAKPPGEPTRASVEAGAGFLSQREPPTLVVVGGGAVLDWARLSWARSVGALDLDTARITAPGTRARPALWLVPSTCGTGAEAGDVAVYQSEQGDKRAAVSPLLLADQVILDGKLLAGIPPAQLAASLCDALSHGIEANLSLVPLQLGKEAGLSCIGSILRAVGATGSSRADRLMEAGFLGGVAAANCSVGVVHAFAHAMAADGLSHALGNASGLVAGLRFNGATPQMATLLDRLGCADVADLEQRIAPVTRAALCGPAFPEPLGRLGDAEYRRAVATRMAGDVALRSNPRRPEPAELEAFLAGLAGLVREHWTFTT